ncbi:hypothetical protein D3C75_503440 [compost metagenome]
MFLLEDEVKRMALDDMIANLKRARELAKVVGFGWEVDDSIVAVIEVAEFEYDV